MMAVWLRIDRKKTGTNEEPRVNISENPCPTVMGGGISSNLVVGAIGQHWLENDGMTTKKKKEIDKPPYRVPLMTEIAKIPWNGFNVASTFSGCGGSTLGYKLAGFRVLYASEFIKEARRTYRANHPDTILDKRDIREVKSRDILELIDLKKGELDLLDGSPPCASFSTAGNREADWGKVKKYSDAEQRTDDLFYEFARLVKGIQPKTFVAENVSGLVKGTAKGYFLEILAALKSCGYRVKAACLDAQWLGVPQARQRIIFVGVREDLNLEPCHPAPLPYRYSVRDAIPWIEEMDRVIHDTRGTDPTRSMGDVTDRPCPTVPAQGQHLFINGVPPELSKKKISKVRVAKEFGNEDWVDADKVPSPTVGASPASGNNHNANGGKIEVQDGTGQVERRKFTIAELRRICSFPDDFELTGSYSQQWERLGRAVPPLMMKAIASTVRDKILMPAAGRKVK
jgi:DNA (cytosine-5)-methyltransferase 1